MSLRRLRSMLGSAVLRFAFALCFSSCVLGEPDWAGKFCTGACPVGFACARDGTCVRLAQVPDAGLCGRLRANESLLVGDALVSCSGRYQLTPTTSALLLQDRDDGSKLLWSVVPRMEPGFTLCELRMQGDGNLVVYAYPEPLPDAGCGSGPSAGLWDSKTGGSYGRPGGGADLVLGDDGVARVADSADVYWSSDAGRIPP